jgi:hypothetical protein
MVVWRFLWPGSSCIVLILSEIQRTLCLFHGPARYAVGIYHRSPYIAVAKESLDSADIIIGLQEVRGETVTKGVGGDPLRELRPPDSLV